MPTYEYECRSCSHSFEAFQAMSEAPLTTCPSCGGAVRRLIGGGTGIIFKGSGFYVNDSKKSSSSTMPASKPAGPATTSPAGSATGGETASKGADGAAPAPKAEKPAAKEAV